jgi:glycosyltransferase involved in cell wall biosynthesis
LVIVGKPRLGEGDIARSFLKLANPDRVTRIDRLTHIELTAFYQAADLFVFPSLYEGFGLPVLEAMMSGVPVVTTPRASIPEVGGKYAVYVNAPTPEEFASKILEILSWSPEYRAQFASSAKNWAKQFSWEKTATQTLISLKTAFLQKRDY